MSDEDDKARRAERSAKRQALIARIQEITDEDHAADRQSLKEMTVEEKQRWFTQSQARIDELMGVQRELDTLHREQERETGSMRVLRRRMLRKLREKYGPLPPRELVRRDFLEGAQRFGDPERFSRDPQRLERMLDVLAPTPIQQLRRSLSDFGLGFGSGLIRSVYRFVVTLVAHRWLRLAFRVLGSVVSAALTFWILRTLRETHPLPLACGVFIGDTVSWTWKRWRKQRARANT